MLNATISDDACRDLYGLILCARPKHFIANRCRRAHYIVFAILQSLPECIVDMHCENTYEVKSIDCAWKRQMQDELCAKKEEAPQNCTNDPAGSTHIQNTCFLTNRFCYFLVINIVAVSILTGATWAIMSIFFEHFCKKSENYVELDASQLDTPPFIDTVLHPVH